MIKTNYFYLAALFFVLLAGQSNAQSKSALEDEAYDFLNNGEFTKAYEGFDKLNARYPKELDYQFKLGICCLSYPEKKERAIEIFTDMKTKYKTKEADYYLARAYHCNYRFDEALAVLQPLVDQLNGSKKKEDKAMLDDAKIIISNCINGKDLIKNKTNAEVENIGSPINSKEIEGVPVITADESMMIFTYVGKKSMGGKVNAALQSDQNGIYTSDIYMSIRNPDSTWKMPEPIISLNTRGNDAAIAISPDGRTLFTFLSTNENEGDILVSKLNGNEFLPPEPLNSNINTPEYWEGSCSISADGKYLYFASERPSGLGGRDIWVSELIDGDWGPAKNLGPKINTPLDDDAPFIHPDGVTLFFSSKGHMSIGGYDIMFSTKVGEEWESPKSMGIPLNTTEDDRYYVINSKGDKGYFSSDRSTADGRGGQDIYVVKPGVLGEKLVLAMFKGIVYGDDNPVEAKFDITKKSNNEAIRPYFSNKQNGKYLLTLKPGANYRIKVSSPGFETVEEDIDLETLKAYIETKKDFYLYSQSFAANNPEKVKKSEPINVIPTATTEIALVTKEEPKKEEVEQIAENTNKINSTDSLKNALALAKEEEKKAQIAKIEEQKAEALAKAAEAKAAAAAKEEERKALIIAKAEEKRAAAAAKEEERKALVLAKAEEKRAAAAAKEEAKRMLAEAKVKPSAEEPSETPSPCNSNLPELAGLKGKSLNDATNYKQLLEIAGNYCANGLVFKVQVGAYRKPENYKYKNLKPLGTIESASYPDGITRFTLKQFSNLKDAEKQRQKAISKGQTDAWIVVFQNGTRYTLEDFIMVDFNGKAIN